MLKKMILSLVTLISMNAFAGDAPHYTEYTAVGVRDAGPNADGSTVEVKFCAFFNIYTNKDNWVQVDCNDPWNYENPKPAVEVTVTPKGDRAKQVTFRISNYSLKVGRLDSGAEWSFPLVLKAQNKFVSLNLVLNQEFDNGTKITKRVLTFKDKRNTLMGDLIAKKPAVQLRHFIEDGSCEGEFGGDCGPVVERF